MEWSVSYGSRHAMCTSNTLIQTLKGKPHMTCENIQETPLHNLLQNYYIASSEFFLEQQLNSRQGGGWVKKKVHSK